LLGDKSKFFEIELRQHKEFHEFTETSHRLGYLDFYLRHRMGLEFLETRYRYFPLSLEGYGQLVVAFNPQQQTEEN
jgi:hypothetical protein